MKAFRLTSIILLCIILLTGVPYLGYVLYQKLGKASAQPLDAIPEKAAFVIRINNPLGLYEDLDRSNLIWKEISNWPGIPDLRQEFRALDSLAQTDRNLRRLVKDNPLYICLTLTGRNEFGLMYLAPAGNDLSPDLIATFLKAHYPGKVSVISTPYASAQILRFQSESMHAPMFMSVSKGVFIISRYAVLVKKAIDRLSLNYIPSSATGFRTIEATAGKRTDANIFVNIPYLSLSAWKLSSEDAKRDLVLLARFADWCGLDVVIRKDELLLSGYTLCSDSNYYTLALYAPQSPQGIEAAGILPDNVTSFTLYSFENLGWYISDMAMRERRLESPAEPGRLSQFADLHKIRLESFFLPWTRNQFCFASAATNDRSEQPYPLTAIQYSDPDSSLKYLVSLGSAIGRKTDSVKYDDRTIYLSDLSEPLNAMFGNLSTGIQANCFILFEGYAVFARSPLHLVQMVNHFKSGTTLGKERSYLDISENVSGLSNIYYYCKPGYTLTTPPSLFSDAMAAYFRNLADSLPKFEALTCQVVNRKGMFYTGISLRFNPNLSNEGPLAWQCTLDTTAAGTPQIIACNSKGNQGVLVTDTLNTLYLVDSMGVILWKKKLYGRVLGTFHPIRIKGSDSLFYLFNTENHLYLVRNDGQVAERFPMKFPLRATNGLTVADYNNTGDYRILIAFRDNRVYNFSLEGIMVDGWSLPSLGEEITKPVQYLVYNHKDHLVISGAGGEFLITDRRGKVRIRPARPFAVAPGSEFCLNRSGKKGAFLTTDTKGKIIVLAENGKTVSVNCGIFSPRHVFFCDDITGNKVPDYIFFDNNTLSVYTRSLKLVFSHRFLHEVSPPHMVRAVNGKKYIGVFSPSTREVFLFDGHGLVETEPAIRGTTPFDVGNLENRSHINLVIGNGKNLKCFRLTQF